MTLEVTRRGFNAGLTGALSRGLVGKAAGGTAMASPATPGGGIDDAYERLVSEFVRIEEAALAAGKGAGEASGASTFVGRQLEAFIGELDSGVDLGASAGDIYDALRVRLRRAADCLKQVGDGEPRRAASGEAAGATKGAGGRPGKRAAGPSLSEAGDVPDGGCEPAVEAVSGSATVQAPARSGAGSPDTE